jgi:NAD+ kinase
MIVSSNSSRALSMKKVVDKALRNSGDKKWFSSDFIITIGGDGFLLETINKYGLNKTYFPLNGGTLGYLLNDVEDLGQTLTKMQYNEWKIHKFSTLKASFHYDGEENITDTAINEVCIERMSSQTTRLDVSVDETNIVSDLAADGLIIATAQGSTGYNYSAGGAICQRDSNAVALTAICPHHPRLPPLVISSSSCINVTASQVEKRPVKLTVDGREYHNISFVNIARGGCLRIIYFDDHNFTSQLVKKVLKR